MLREAKTVIEEINNINSSLYNVAKIMANNDDIDWKDLMYMKDALGRNCAALLETWYEKVMDIRVISGVSRSRISKEKRAKKYIEYIEN